MMAAARLFRRGRAGARSAGSIFGSAELQHGKGGTSTSSSGPSGEASWVLVQRDGGSSTTAAGSATGAQLPLQLLASCCRRVLIYVQNAYITLSFCTSGPANCRHGAAGASVQRRRRQRHWACGTRLLAAPPAPGGGVAAAGHAHACGLSRLSGAWVPAEHAVAGSAPLRRLRKRRCGAGHRRTELAEWAPAALPSCPSTAT
jgi:hypothetical protein